MKIRLLALALLLACFTPLAHAQLCCADSAGFSGHAGTILFYQSTALPILIKPAVPLPPSTATPGYVLIGTVPAGTTTFVDTTNCKPSTSCNYEVTAYNSAGESQPDGPITLAWGATNTKTTLSWVPAVGGGAPTGYNVYFLASPSAPTGLSGTVN